MNILIITPYYPPVTSTLSTMMQELAIELSSIGHKVNVATILFRNKLNAEIRTKSFDTFSLEKGIGVIRIQPYLLSSSNFILRGLSQLILPFALGKDINKFVKEKIDVVIVYTPPLSLTTLGNKTKKKYNSKYILNVQDIFPQNAIDLGIMKNKVIIKFFEYIEKKAYQTADEITSHTETSRELLIKNKCIPAGKIHLIPNWIDTKQYQIADRTNFYRKKYGLENKLIFLFAGVMGPSQGLDLIINAAKDVNNDIPDICFLFVGDGLEKKRLMKMAESYAINNVAFQPLVSLEEYPNLVKEVDAGLVCLSNKNKTPVVPAKILGYMTASIPVVALLNKESDGHKLISRAQCGYSIASDASREKIKRLIEQVYNEKQKLQQYGKNGHRYVLEHFTKEVCTGKFLKLI